MKNKSEIVKYLKDAVNDGVFPGCHVAIIQGDKKELFCVGNKSLIPTVQINQEDTIYDLASLTKVVVTTTLTLKLIEKNMLQLQTSVSMILPQFKHKSVTIEHLLTHTSGLPADSRLEIDSVKEDMLKMIYHLELLNNPGDSIIYSDLGFILLGEIIEKITHKSLKELSEEYLFKPMNMGDTSYLPELDKQQRCAPTELSPLTHQVFKGQAHDRKARIMSGVSGHAGLFSTIEDMSHFARMLMYNGVYNNQQILTPASIALIKQTKVFDQEISRSIGYITNNPVPFSQGISANSIMHTGFTGSSIMIDFDSQLAVIVLSNRIHPDRDNPLILTWRAKFYDFIMK